jgi:hypothetical protein
MEGFELIVVFGAVCVIGYFCFTRLCKFLVEIRNNDQN